SSQRGARTAPRSRSWSPRSSRPPRWVVDVLEQCAAIGELHHALNAGLMERAGVHAELAEVVAGSKPGRRSRPGGRDLDKVEPGCEPPSIQGRGITWTACEPRSPELRVETATDQNDGPISKHRWGQVKLVAGAGFEPATFGL